MRVKSEITDTLCVCCARPLDDAESVEMGIGPICRAGAELADRDPDWHGAVKASQTAGCLDLIATHLDAQDARRACNAAVKLMALDQKHRLNPYRLDVVRALGFTTLASKIEESLFGEKAEKREAAKASRAAIKAEKAAAKAAKNADAVFIDRSGESLYVSAKIKNRVRFDAYIAATRAVRRRYDSERKCMIVPVSERSALWRAFIANIPGMQLVIGGVPMTIPS